jgi:hypothetical protein
MLTQRHFSPPTWQPLGACINVMGDCLVHATSQCTQSPCGRKCRVLRHPMAVPSLTSQWHPPVAQARMPQHRPEPEPPSPLEAAMLTCCTLLPRWNPWHAFCGAGTCMPKSSSGGCEVWVLVPHTQSAVVTSQVPTDLCKHAETGHPVAAFNTPRSCHCCAPMHQPSKHGGATQSLASTEARP